MPERGVPERLAFAEREDAAVRDLGIVPTGDHVASPVAIEVVDDRPAAGEPRAGTIPVTSTEDAIEVLASELSGSESA